jgi:hypothetical protein
MDVRSFNVTPVLHHFVKTEPLDKIIFFQKKFSIFKCVSPNKKIFKHDEQKGVTKIQ